MTMVTSYDWESDTYTNHTDTLAQHEAWREAVEGMAERAKHTLPDCAGRVDSAVKLVLSGDVELMPDGKARVRSQSKARMTYHVVNGECTCKDYSQAPGNWCKHRIAMGLAKRARTLAERRPHAAPTPQPDQAETATTAPTAPEPAPQPAETPSTIPQQHLVTIQGKAFIRYCGLLQMAQQRGLVSLTAEWTYNDTELSLAHAVAIFADGRRFEESGDASPANCTRMVAGHFRRVALTRAKARVLRDALGIDLVAVEELAESE